MPAMSRDFGDAPILPDTLIRPIVVEIFNGRNAVKVTQRLQAFLSFLTGAAPGQIQPHYSEAVANLQQKNATDLSLSQTQ